MKKILLMLILLNTNSIFSQIDCSKIERKIDDFTEEIKINPPLFYRERMNDMNIYKFIKKTKTIYTISLYAFGNTINFNSNGVIVIFDDGTKWTSNDSIEGEYDGNGKYKYHTYLGLTEEDVGIFSTKKISKYRLYIYDTEIKAKDAERFRANVECVINTK